MRCSVAGRVAALAVPRGVLILLKSMVDGPEKKFYLIKYFGPATSDGVDRKTLSCADIIHSV